MAKDAVTDWSTTANDNTDVGGIDLGEGTMLVAAVNGALREIMKQVAAGIDAGSFVAFPLSVASASSAAYADFAEDTDNGAHRVRLIGPTSLAADVTVTLPSTTGTVANAAGAGAASEVIAIAVSDETTAITTGTAKVTFRMPYAFTLTAVRASLSTASSSGLPTFDINEAGSTILSTKLSIDANEKTSTTAAAAAVISDTSLADDAEMTIDIDVAGTGAKGAKVYLIGYKT
jgi:hypothetical protein